MSAENFVDVDKMILTFVFAIPRNIHDKNYENVIMSSTFSSCKIHDGNRGNFIVKMIMENADDVMDFHFGCPFMKV